MSRLMADKLQVKAGDRIYAYFIGDDDVRTRRFTIEGIYQTNMTRFDEADLLHRPLHRLPSQRVVRRPMFRRRTQG